MDMVKINPVWALAVVDRNLATQLNILQHDLNIAFGHAAFLGEGWNRGPRPAIIVGIVGQGDQQKESRPALTRCIPRLARKFDSHNEPL